MFSPELANIAIMIMMALAGGGIVYVVIYPFLSGERQVNKRIQTVAKRSASDRKARVATVDNNARRKQVQESLKELEARKSQSANVSIKTRLERAGLQMEVNNFYILSAGLGLAIAIILLLTGTPIYVAFAAALAAGFGFPRWVLSFLSKRRQKKFTEEFANAIDIIVRGVKSGLPVNDCMKIIAAEAQEPVRSEFMELVEQQRVGVTLPQALEKMYERMPLEEVNFFMIVISIQQKSGGNLSEALGNLSGVLRDRKKLRAKIKAFSAEAKASAAIIGCLPVAVMLLVYITTPEYISLLWQHTTGHIMLACSAIWMTLGIIVMRQMINFDY